MKKLILVVAILTVGFVVLSPVSPALAAESQRGGPKNGLAGFGSRVGRGEGTPLAREIALDGQLEDLIHANLALSLGISVPELEEREAAGETLIEIALSLGFSSDEAATMLVEARADALVQAVAEDLVSQDQADWLSSRAFGSRGNYGVGDCLTD